MLLDRYEDVFRAYRTLPQPPWTGYDTPWGPQDTPWHATTREGTDMFVGEPPVGLGRTAVP